MFTLEFPITSNLAQTRPMDARTALGAGTALNPVTVITLAESRPPDKCRRGDATPPHHWMFAHAAAVPSVVAVLCVGMALTGAQAATFFSALM